MVATELPAGCVLHGVPYGQMCFACMPATCWPAVAPVLPSLPGWVCPQCSRSIAPAVQSCPFCVPRVVVTSRQSGDRMVPADPPEDVRGGLLPGPLIRLPPHMDSPGFAWHAKIGGQWRELFRGLQARRLSVSHDETLGAVADIEFRLTPQDGQERD